MIKRINTRGILNQIIQVQPMSLPSGNIFYYKYDKNYCPVCKITVDSLSVHLEQQQDDLHKCVEVVDS